MNPNFGSLLHPGRVSRAKVRVTITRDSKVASQTWWRRLRHKITRSVTNWRLKRCCEGLPLRKGWRFGEHEAGVFYVIRVCVVDKPGWVEKIVWGNLINDIFTEEPCSIWDDVEVSPANIWVAPLKHTHLNFGVSMKQPIKAIKC